MITDQDVLQLFRNIGRIHISFTDPKKARWRPNQIFSGVEDIGFSECGRHMEVFQRFNVIPKDCFDCYKVIITPRNVMEHFKLLMIFGKIALPRDNKRKCMVESRKDCSGTYKGYVYCNGIKEGNEVRKIIRMAVSEDISPNISVTLRRGCSEFALVYPEFARVKRDRVFMRYRKEWKIHEDFFDNNFHAVIGSDSKVDILNLDADHLDINADILMTYTPWDIYCMQYSLAYAATIGDASYLTIAGTSLPPIPDLKRPPFKNTIPFKSK